MTVKFERHIIFTSQSMIFFFFFLFLFIILLKKMFLSVKSILRLHSVQKQAAPSLQFVEFSLIWISQVKILLLLSYMRIPG